MKYVILCCILCILSFNAPAQLALEEIDVLVVFDIPAYAIVANKTVWVEAREETVNALLENTPRGEGLEFDFHASSYVIPYSAQGKTSVEVRNWMEGLQGHSIWATIRGDNDLIMMVAGDWSSVACGIASELPDNIDIVNGLTKFLTAIRLSGCTNVQARLIAHEMGHLLGADHQLLYFSDGTLDIAGTQAGFDRDVFSPMPYNHAWSEFDDSQYTILGTPTSTLRTNAYFSSGSASNGEDPQSHDVMRVLGNGTEFYGPITDHSWTTVSRYRPLPRAQEPSVWTMPCFCLGKDGYQEASWATGSPSVPGATFVVERKNLVTGGWNEVYEGGPECLIFDGALAGGVLYRVKTIIEGVLDSIYVEFSLSCLCDQGGGGGPGL